jgi:transcriptional regulator with XRE-family HTH domain
MPAAPHIGARIRRARKLLGLTQQELAAKIGVSRNTVDAWENGRSYPKRYDVALEEALDISLAGEPEPAPALVATDEWEQSVLDDRYLSDDDKRDLITSSRAARAEAVRLRRERRQQEAAEGSARSGGLAGGRSGHGRTAG